ncbi:MAG: VTT domain-containing protein [Candidatus Micrarchaeota archaeon]
MKLSDGDKVKAAVQIILGIVIAVLVLLFSNQIALLKDYGYIGVFLISLLSSATVLIPAPGWAIVIAMGGVLNPYLVGIAAGIGSGIGEITGYAVGSGAATIIAQDSKEAKWIKKYDLLAIFLLAFIPNPVFDVAGLAAGALRVPVWKFLLATILGRTLRFILLAYFGAWALAQF